MREADIATDLATPAHDSSDAPDQATPESGSTRAVFELTALVAHVMEAQGVKEKSKGGKKEPNEDEGHIVAHIKVWNVSWI